MTWLLEDPARLARFRAGDRVVLAALYDRHAPDVARLVARVCVRPHAQADFVQETFTRAFGEKGRAAYDGERPFRSYLLGITRNLLIDRLRHDQRASAIFTVATDFDAALESYLSQTTNETSPEAVAMRAELQKVCQDFLASLAPLDRQVVELRFVRSLSRREACEACGLSARQLRTREQHLREHLFDLLTARGHGTGGLGGAPLLLLIICLVEAASWVGAVENRGV